MKKQFDFQQAELKLRQHKKHNKWMRAVTVAAAIVVFITTYMLILPAITLEKKPEQASVDSLASQEENMEAVQPDEEGAQLSLFSEPSTSEPVKPAANEVPSGAMNGVVRAGEPIELTEKHVTNLLLWYKKKGLPDDEKNWKPVIGAENIPGDADIAMRVYFKDVQIDDLIAADGKLIFPQPDILKDAEPRGKLLAGGEEVGTLEMSGENILLKLNIAWLQEQLDAGHDALEESSFDEEAHINISKVEDNKGEITIGDINVSIDFEEDVQAKHGNVSIEKTLESPTVIEIDGAEYLKYHLKVSTPDGAEAVTVVDNYENNKYIAEYVGVKGEKTSTNKSGGLLGGPQEILADGMSVGNVYVGNGTTTEDTLNVQPSGADVVKPGKLVWKIGDMKPGEERTLMYYVKLEDGYTGNHPKSDGKLHNIANVYSKTYTNHEERESDAIFTPQAGMDMYKESAQFEKNENDGGGIVTYKIWMKANATNNYILEQVKLRDSLDHKDYPTDSKLLGDLSFVEGSFELYEGKGKNELNVANLKQLSFDENALKMNSNGNGYELNIGDMEPNAERVLVYKVKVSEEIFEKGALTNGKETVDINNRAQLFPNTPANAAQYNGYKHQRKIEKVWDRKYVNPDENPTKNATTVSIPMTDDVYKKVNEPEDPKPSEFTIPAGAFQYQVVVNETGDWNLTNADFRDTLGQYLKMTGYLQVQAYEYQGSDVPPQPNAGTDAVIKKLKSMTPSQTSWLKIDGQEFSFQPGQIGLDNKKYAYLLTYYAVPHELGTITSTQVNNSFTISGSASGNGNGGITLPIGIDISTSVTVNNDKHFKTQKTGWYYEQPNGTNGKGVLYWLIKVNGNVISKGVLLRDVPDQGGYKVPSTNVWAKGHEIGADSIAGVYKGVLPDKDGIQGIRAYDSFLELQEVVGADKALQALSKGENADYTWKETKLSGEAQASWKLEFQREISLDEVKEEAVYIVVKTVPTEVPSDESTDPRNKFAYINKLSSSGDGGTTWSEESKPMQKIEGNDGCLKENSGVYYYDGKNVTILQNGTRNVQPDLAGLDGVGTYVSWTVQVNRYGMIEGGATVTDILPEGMKPVYVKYSWYDNGNYNSNQIPIITTLNEGVEGWQQRLYSTGVKPCTYYYNESLGQLKWRIEGLKKLTDTGKIVNDDQCNVQFQVVCKLVDKDLLQGGGTKDFKNTISVIDDKGRTYQDDATVPITRVDNTLSKAGLWQKGDGNKYRFKIEINAKGEELAPGEGNTLTLVDEVGASLELDVSSIRIVEGIGDSITENMITSFVINVENGADGGKIYRISNLPDKKPMTITYDARVLAAPGEKVSISNKAHWEGFDTPQSGEVVNGEFSYSAGGVIETGATPLLKLQKLDAANSNPLSGASFQLEELKQNGDTFVPTGKMANAVTGADGNVEFLNAEGNRWMEFNTVYRLTEIAAPDGYLINREPYLFVIAKALKDEATGESNFPPILTEWENMENVKIDVIYGGVINYTRTVYNSKGEAHVEKIFQDESGETLTYEQIPDGDYTFGIFESEQNAGSTEEPLQKLTIRYKDGKATYLRGTAEITAPNFTNLTLSTTDTPKYYYIYELDDDGKPILNDQIANVDGKTFTVNYGSGGNQVEAVKDAQEAGNIPTVTVRNTHKSFVLPETGGMGTNRYTFMGTLLVLAATILLYKKIKGNKEEQERSTL